VYTFKRQRHAMMMITIMFVIGISIHTRASHGEEFDYAQASYMFICIMHA
jgi:hypothetical protein